MNALDRETLGALHDRLAELAEDAEARVVVLTGAGDRAFVAGADIKYMSGLSVLEAQEWGGLGHAGEQPTTVSFTFLYCRTPWRGRSGW